MTKPTDLGYIFMSMEPDMKDNGKMIYSMDMARKHGLMDQFMKVSIIAARSMGMVLIIGMTDLHMKETGMKIK